MTRYEPHCDCLGGHASMVPDPNGRWCRADEGWQDFSTAPKDGRKFDAWCVHPETKGHGVRIPDVQMRGDGSGFGFISHLSDGVQWNYLDGRNRSQLFPAWEPTHWRPLPAPPTITEADHA